MLPEVFKAQYYDAFRELKEAVDENRSPVVFYTAENAKYHLASVLERTVLFVVQDTVEARRAKEMLEAYTDGEVYLFPEREDTLRPLRSVVSWTREERLRAMTALLTGEAAAVVATAEAVLQFLPKKELFGSFIKTVKKGEEIDRDAFVALLAGAGFSRKDAVSAKGEFTVRGDRLELWRATDELPVRLEFFGDEVESIRVFAPDTMMSLREVPQIVVFPVSDVLIAPDVRKNLIAKLKKELRVQKQKLQELTESFLPALDAGENDPSLYFLTPFFRDQSDTLFDYLPESGVTVFYDLKALDDKLKLTENVMKTRAKGFIEAGEAFPSQTDALLKREELYRRVETVRKLGFSLITSQNAVYQPKAVFSIKALPVPKYVNRFEDLVNDLKSYSLNGATVVLAAGSAAQAVNLQNILKDFDFSVPIKEPTMGEIVLTGERIRSGFVYPKEKLVLIGTEDLERKSSGKRKSDKEKRDAFVMPKVGEYVVHEVHGIGLAEGVKQIETSNGLKDFYVVLYKNNDRLYLPVDQMDLLERYSGGGAPSLHRLGGKEFERVKQKVRESTKKMAIDLLELYEKRETAKGHRYPPDTVWQKELEDAFPYRETDDQLSAIREIKEDMEKGKVMDRLLAGDVGFGKTEVAIRAIFKTVLEGKQAALLAPTTVLAEQHLRTVSERLKPFGVKVETLSRLVPDVAVGGILKRISTGETQVVVATHRLLSKDVKFFDLGLLVLDEEQRFGVEHKEKIKLLKNNVNVLTLSATPIPRTLHMALSGIRDISTLETPPVDRLPVETYVTEYSDTLVKDAVMKELSRGGQVFILYNSVEHIEKYFIRLKALLPNVPMIYAHGQMDGRLMEDAIMTFYRKEALVMVSTTIIENGIDIADANTLIVLDSDRLGLSQMYQLRGRVGRSNVNAFAYFTVPEGKVLTTQAEKRLAALLENTELGSGFKIAMRDLEIRGAGNVLGKEQHGNMEKVGYDMYCRLIKESIDELRGKTVEQKNPVEITTDADTGVPTEYISDQEGRVRLFKRVSYLKSERERADYIAELTDAYGFPPQSVLNLLAVGEIKNIAESLGVKKVEITASRCYASFRSMQCFQNEKLIGAASEMRRDVVVSPETSPAVLFRSNGLTKQERIGLALKFFEKAVSDDESRQ